MAPDTRIEDLRGCSDGADRQRDTRRLATQGARLGGQDFPNVKMRSTNTVPVALGGNPPHQTRCAGNPSSPVEWADAPELCWTTDCPPMQGLALPTDLRHDAIDVLSSPSRRADLILGILAKIEDTRQTDSFRPPGVGDAVARSKTTSRAIQCLSAEVVVVGES